MSRIRDLFIVVAITPLVILPALVIALSVKLSSKGPIIYWSERIGKDNQRFRMPKFRTMRIGTPALATHLLPDPDLCITTIGKFLRRSSLDELPQLLSIAAGDMSFVGPRPALFNQYDLIDLRTKHGVHKLTPGLTGWAQINGRDELAIPDKVKLDYEYLLNKSFLFDLYILGLTIVKAIKKEGISH